jgi:hypothetical protein
MSRGLGVEQRAILAALQGAPDRWWSRMALQQAAWGPQPGSRADQLKRYPPSGVRPYKNVCWRRDDRSLSEASFTRALRSLERRALLVRHPSGRAYRLASPAAVADAQALAVAASPVSSRSGPRMP